MASSVLKEGLQVLEDWWFSPLGFGSLGAYKRITDPQERQEILAHFERPGWKHAVYKAARTLRELWGLPSEPDTQTAITEFFIGVNTRHWENVGRWQKQILDFLRSGAKDSLGEVAENLHKQWGQEIPVVRELISGRTDAWTKYVGYVDVPDIKRIVGVTEDQPVTEQIARLLDPYFHQGEAFLIGEQICQEQGIPVEEGVSWGIKWGFIKRNTVDLAKEEDPIRRGEIFKWLKDDTQVDRALQRLTVNLEFNYSLVAITKFC